MSVIFHASDLHFGRANPDVSAALLREIKTRNPDIAILSGDFTQIGSREEFIEARDFLQQLPCPYIAVPGNHDIPAANIRERFLRPYRRFKKYICADLAPAYETEDAFILGINTARSMVPHWNWANGTISRAQLKLVQQRFNQAKPHQWKILVCHHPLYAIMESPIHTMVWRSGRLMTLLRSLQVNMVMTGHIHHASVTFDKQDEAGIYHIGAASAFSTRLRTQGNGYNLIEINGSKAIVTLMGWSGTEFTPMERHEILLQHHG